ncbi:hypothetical protein GEMRC1_004345 [Eukaryota sp. GEM-RC1]
MKRGVEILSKDIFDLFQTNMTLSSPTMLFTSESVTEGHPDKVCDQVSDAILDACLKEDPLAKVAIETAAKNNNIFLLGEITTTASVDFERVVRETLQFIGYDDVEKGIDYKTCGVVQHITVQSGEIARGVHVGRAKEELGAGDQGIMFGYATNETAEFMPLSHLLATRLSRRLADVRKKGILPWLRPDGKTQVTVEYKIEDGGYVPIRVHTIVISTQHDRGISNADIQKAMIEHVVNPIVPCDMLDDATIYHINPSGEFVTGGPAADAGLTGRKIIVDTYGGWGAHGGGAFSGKDYTKVDRSACYMARWIAKSVVAAGLCKRILVQLSYAIGLARPLSIYVDTFGTATKGDDFILEVINKNFDCSLGAIIEQLDLTKPNYRPTAANGHFGNPSYTWEVSKVLDF